jgi:hypothetical protein
MIKKEKYITQFTLAQIKKQKLRRRKKTLIKLIKERRIQYLRSMLKSA